MFDVIPVRLMKSWIKQQNIIMKNKVRILKFYISHNIIPYLNFIYEFKI